MKLIYKIGIISFALFAALSCMQENDPQTGEGYLDLRVECNPEVEVVPVLRSTDEEPVVAVRIVNAADGSEVFSAPDKEQITDPISLKTGSYKAYASSKRWLPNR